MEIPVCVLWMEATRVLYQHVDHVGTSPSATTISSTAP